MTKTPNFLRYLELDARVDERSIRRAYARKLKLIDPGQDPAGFQALREAYEAAMNWCRFQKENVRQSDPNAAIEVPRDRADAPAPHGNATVTHDAAENSESSDRAGRKEDAIPSVAPNPYGAADDVFREFVATLGDNYQGLDQVRSGLQLCLQDPRLIHLESRDLFEWRIVCWLADGWRPGNEALIGVAIESFGWETDRRRLHRFGDPGEFVDRATSELAVFKQQDARQQKRQLELIRKLRTSRRPSHGELVKDMPLMAQIVAQFPVLIQLIASAEVIRHWYAWDKEIPRWRRWLVYRPSSPKPRDNRTSNSRLPAWAIAVALLTIIRGLASVGSNASGPTSPQPYSFAGSSGMTPDTLSRLPNSAGGNAPIPPPSSDKTVAALVRGKADAANCMQVAVLASDYRIGTPKGLPDPSPVFDRFVVACVRTKNWPFDARSTPIARESSAREVKRTEAAMKSVLNSGPIQGMATPSPRAPGSVMAPAWPYGQMDGKDGFSSNSRSTNPSEPMTDR